MKQLTFQHGPTVSRVAQTLWIRRLETWREAVGQDVRKPFTGDDLIRFMDVIIRKSRSRYVGKKETSLTLSR